MKKNLFIWLACALVFFNTGCMTIIEEVPSPEEAVDPTLIQLNLDIDVNDEIQPYFPIKTPEEKVRNYDVRWYIEAFTEELGGRAAYRQILTNQPDADGKLHIQVPVDLHAFNYKFVVWMDFVDKGSYSDKYYRIPRLSHIHVLDKPYYIGDEDLKDAFVGHAEIDLTPYREQWNAQVDYQMTLERPLAKMELVTTDISKYISRLTASQTSQKTEMEKFEEMRASLDSIVVQVDYASYFPTSFNAYTNKPNDSALGMSFKTKMRTQNMKEALLASDFIFVNGSESAVIVNMTMWDGKGNLLNTVEGVRVPIVRSHLTTVKDEFLTRSFSPGIGIDTEYDGEINITIPD